MCGGKIKELADEAADETGKLVSQIDPTTETGLANLATGGLYGSVTHTGEMLEKLSEEPERPGETEAEKAAADVAVKEHDFARELDFVKDEYRDRVDRLGTEEMQNAVKGTANINAQSQVNNASNSVNLNLQQKGIDPSSGRATSTNTVIDSSGGEALGLSDAESSFALDSAHLEGKNNSVAMALGEKTKAIAGLQDIASGANSLASAKAKKDFNDKAATSSAVGTATGLGLSAYLDNK